MAGAILDRCRDLPGGHHERFEESVTAHGFQRAVDAEGVRRAIPEGDHRLDRIHEAVGAPPAVGEGAEPEFGVCARALGHPAGDLPAKDRLAHPVRGEEFGVVAIQHGARAPVEALCGEGDCSQTHEKQGVSHGTMLIAP